VVANGEWRMDLIVSHSGGYVFREFPLLLSDWLWSLSYAGAMTYVLI
jgi:hypothetical protein